LGILQNMKLKLQIILENISYMQRKN